MFRSKKIEKSNRTALNYIISGISKTFTSLIGGVVILRWLEPDVLGEWQSITVFTGYFLILTLGTTSGLSRELPFLIGNGQEQLAIQKLSASTFYIIRLSIGLIILGLLISTLLLALGTISMKLFFMINMAITISSINVFNNQLSATYRSSKSFSKLSSLQWLLASFSLVSIPLVYFFQIYGYVVYYFSASIILFLGLYKFQPYKIKGKYNYDLLIGLIKLGAPIYFLNYISVFAQTIPRLFIIVFGTPLVVGLYSPGATIYNALDTFPAYINRYFFPRLTYKYGKTQDKRDLFISTIRTALIIGIVMLFLSTFVALILPFLIEIYFPKYSAGLLPAQIIVFFAVFNGMISVIHNSLFTLIATKALAFAVIGKIIFYSLSIYIVFFFSTSLLISASGGMVLGELLSFILFYYIFNYVTKKQ